MFLLLFLSALGLEPEETWRVTRTRSTCGISATTFMNLESSLENCKPFSICYFFQPSDHLIKMNFCRTDDRANVGKLLHDTYTTRYKEIIRRHTHYRSVDYTTFVGKLANVEEKRKQIPQLCILRLIVHLKHIAVFPHSFCLEADGI